MVQRIHAVLEICPVAFLLSPHAPAFVLLFKPPPPHRSHVPAATITTGLVGKTPPGGKRERLRHRAVPVPPEADALPRAAELPPHVEARRLHVLQEHPHGGADGVVRNSEREAAGPSGR